MPPFVLLSMPRRAVVLKDAEVLCYFRGSISPVPGGVQSPLSYFRPVGPSPHPLCPIPRSIEEGNHPKGI